MSWASKRKMIYGGVFVLFALLIAAPFVYVYYPRPTCSDGTQNQDETGVDCGGVCQRVCKVPGPKVLWSRPFLVAPGVYSIAAFVTNPNAPANLIAKNVSYQFKLYDAKNVLVAVRDGKITIPAKSTFPIFEGGVATGNREATKASFAFTEEPIWEHSAAAEVIKVTNIVPPTGSSTQTLSADLVNTTALTISNIKVTTILFDQNKNAIASSQTYVDAINSQQAAHIVFTWPVPFGASVSSVEIYPEITVAP